ncbi:MAG: hypothetical protein LBS50_09450 [Prevotellaceae bacterium]|nr:hypothetical protein [Prevotellaceae bacterium]
MQKNIQIDTVITWVDGNAPAHKRKMQPFLPQNAKRSDDINGKTRYNSEGEIYYCIASILRFAPFVRKIFLVTDEQKPEKLDEFLQKNFPENKIPVEIIDHKIIFRDYEKFLPVFSSRAVETCIHRIPDLSENYVYFNDDFFLINPIKKTDWFDGEKIIAYGYWRNLLLDRLLWLIKPIKNGHKPVGFKDGMIAAAKRLNYRWQYFHLNHLPHPIKKSVITDFYEKNPQLFLKNISYKFRSSKQFNTCEIYYLLMLQAQKAVIKPAKNHLLYIKPVSRGENYLKRKLKMYESNPNLKFCCIGSLDQAIEPDRKTLLDWLKNLLNTEF